MAMFQIDTDSEGSLTSMLRAHAERGSKGPKRRAGSIHGSSYYKCQRQQVYGLLGYEQAPEERPSEYNWKWALASPHGNHAHDHVQDEFYRAGLCVVLPDGRPAIEVNYSEPGILQPAVFEEYNSLRRGVRADSILLAKHGDLPVEIKELDNKYLRGDERKYLGEKLGDFQMQLMDQMYWWRDHITGKRPEHGVIYLINRSDWSDREEYVVDFDEEIYAGELKRMASVRDHWLAGKLPDPEPSRGCKFCPWWEVCPATKTAKNKGRKEK